MRVKEADVPYCGVREDVIKNAKPKLNEEVLAYMNQWVFERYRVKMRKEAGLPQPWTDDQVLRDFRFTNVRRLDDRETIYFVKGVVETDMSLNNKIYNAILFRLFNNWKTIELMGGPFDWETGVDIHQVFLKLEDMLRDPSRLIWSNAFNQGGLKRAAGTESYVTTLSDSELEGVNYDQLPVHVMLKFDKYYGDLWGTTKIEAEKYVELHPEYRIITRTDQNIPLRVVKLVDKLVKDNFAEKILTTTNQDECYKLINSIRGLGVFLSYQIFVDLTYIPEFPYSNNEYAQCGPGTTLGLSYLFEDKDGMTDPECVFWMKDFIQEAWKDRDTEYDLNALMTDLEPEDRILCVADLCNCMCELSKYTKDRKSVV